MLKKRVVSVFVLLAMLLTFVSSTVMAAEPPPPDVQLDNEMELKPAPSPPDDAKVYTITSHSTRGGLSGPSGGYAVLSAIMEYYDAGIYHRARAGAKIELIAATAYAYAYATLRQGSLTGTTQSCYTACTDCTAYTSYYAVSGYVTAQADTTVYWSAGGYSNDSAYANYYF